MERTLDRNINKQLQLTRRQKQCIDLLSRGYTPKQIGIQIGISKRTVNYHLFCLLQRFNAETYPHLIYTLAMLDYFK